MMALSFHQFQSEQEVPALTAAVEERKAELARIAISGEDEVRQYHTLTLQLAKLKEKMRAKMNEPAHALPYLRPGRLVRVRVRHALIACACACAFLCVCLSVCVLHVLP